MKATTTKLTQWGIDMSESIDTPVYTLISVTPIGEYLDWSKSGFKLTQSNKAYEGYASTHPEFDCSVRVVNESYGILGDSIDEVVDSFKDTMQALRVAAMHKRAEGCDVGEGTLILQSRQLVEIMKREDGKIRLRWRGKLDRIPAQCNAILISLI